mmetsp:Transcript_44346/g.107208  ORF Transcript_44346/g.107208 Transcript_44346/m.107208 type:complete len:981 (+) Transcript_44346:371-3313(+)
MDRIKKMVKTGSKNGGVGRDGDGDSEINSNAGEADHEMNGASDDWSLGGGPPGSSRTRSGGIFGRRGGTRNAASGAVSLSAVSSRGRQSVNKLLSGGQSVVSAIEARSRRSLSRRRRQTSSSPQRRSSSTPRASPRPSGSASVSASPRSGSKRDKKKDKKSRRSSDYTLNLDARLRELNAQPSPKGMSDDKSLTARTTGGAYRSRGHHHKSKSNNDIQSRLEALALERTSESPKRDRKSSSGRSSSQTRDPESPKKLRKSRRTREDVGDRPVSNPNRAASSPAISDLHGSHSGSIGSTESKKKKKKKRHSASDISPEEMQKLRERRDQLKKEANRKKKKGRKSKTDEDGSQSTITTHDSNDPKSPKKKKDKRRRSKIDTDGFPAAIPEKGDPAGAKGSNSNPFNDVISSALSEDDRGRGKQSEIEAGLSSFDDIWGMESARFDDAETKDEPKMKKSATDLIAERKAIEKARSFMKINDGTQNEGVSQPTTKTSAVAEEPAPPPSEASLSAAPTSTTTTATTTATTSSTHADDDAQQEELLKLQHQLSEALQKVLVMSEEQIQDKDQFLKASSELGRVKVELAEAVEERGELIDQVKDRDADLKECQKRIGKLEEAIERQLDTQDALEVKLERSEDEIEKLLVEMQEMETKMSNGESVGGGGGGGASLVELHEAKKAVENKNDEIKKLNTKIEDLEKELKDAMTVPQLQIDELDEENKALQGRLKGEKLEANAKLAAKEEMIKNLQTELDQYKGSSDAQDLVSARTKLNEARADATAVREDLDTAKRMIEEMQNEREDLLEKNSILLDNVKLLDESVQELTEKSDMLSGKVLDWTEKTYDWKAKAETLERKLDAYKDEDANSGMVDSEVSDDVEDVAPQGLLLQAAMDKSASNNKKKWGIFGGKQDQNMSVDEIRIKTLQERNDAMEESITEIRSEMVRMQTAHKEELYNAQKKIARLEGENDALSLQNATLSQLASQDDQ